MVTSTRETERKKMSNEEFEILAAKAIKADQAAMDKFEEESEIDSLFNSLVADLQPMIKEEA